MRKKASALVDGVAKGAAMLAIALAFCYLVAGAYYGYLVGHAISAAKASNPMIAIAADAVGHQSAERFAIAKMGVPAFIVRAPTFLLVLRLVE